MARRIALSNVSNAPDANALLAEEQLAAEAEAYAADAAAAAERPPPEGDAAMETNAASPSYQHESETTQPHRRGGRLSPGHTAGSAASFRNQLMLPEWCGGHPYGLVLAHCRPRHNGSPVAQLTTPPPAANAGSTTFRRTSRRRGTSFRGRWGSAA